MILFFSGTGNSAFAAKYISEQIGDETVNLFGIIKNKADVSLTSSKPWVVVTPTYCWQLPIFVRDRLLNVEFNGSKEIYFVLTCGGEIGDAGKYLKKLCEKLQLDYRGVAEIVMPENYIALFDSCGEDEAKNMIEGCKQYLDETAKFVLKGERIPEKKSGVLGKIYSSVVNPAFYSLVVKDKKFYATDECIGCGICENKCILDNIRIENNRPVWQGNCTHCMACISYCPQNAIEYGKNTKGKRRYVCPF